MKITYTGRQVELAPAQLKKLEAQFAKTGKLLDGKGDCEIHVVLSLQRHLQRAEATVSYFGHELVGLATDSDLFTAIHAAAQKLEKQSLKVRAKWRDGARKPHKIASEVEGKPTPAEPEVQPQPAVQVYRVNHHERRKPMTLEEALLEMDNTRDYMVYRDASSDCVSVLIRRRDGHFDLVEG
ncbi:MAG: ribosome-associated translation inhibitor RaiA [Bryobacteraceae bacterium]|jgi:putative sigma-54 modulation protein